jgi:hypothetical protein
MVNGGNNMNSNPLLEHLPVAMRFTSAAGAVDTVWVTSASSYFGAGDVIEVGDDNVPRAVQGLSGNEITFDPPLAAPSEANVRVDNWGAGATDLEADLRLQPTSPCIDAAEDNQATCADIEGRGRVDIGTPDSDSGYSDMGAHEHDGPACDANEVYAGRIYWPGCDARGWSEADNLCLRFGGHLASIGSAGENGLVQGLASGTTWIGASEDTSEGNWVWSDGQGWGYTNWSGSPGQPDDTGALNCAAMYGTSGNWYDEACGDANAFVCERP